MKNIRYFLPFAVTLATFAFSAHAAQESPQDGDERQSGMVVIDETTLQGLLRRMDAFEGRDQQQQKDIQQLKEQNQQLKEQNQQLQKDIQQLQQDFQQQQQRNQQLQQDLQQQQQRNQQLQQDLQQQQQRNQHLQQDLQQQQQRNQHLQQDLQQQQQQNQQLQQGLQQQQQQNQQLQRQDQANKRRRARNRRVRVQSRLQDHRTALRGGITDQDLIIRYAERVTDQSNIAVGLGVLGGALIGGGGLAYGSGATASVTVPALGTQVLSAGFIGGGLALAGVGALGVAGYCYHQGGKKKDSANDDKKAAQDKKRTMKGKERRINTALANLGNDDDYLSPDEDGDNEGPKYAEFYLPDGASVDLLTIAP